MNIKEENKIFSALEINEILLLPNLEREIRILGLSEEKSIEMDKFLKSFKMEKISPSKELLITGIEENKKNSFKKILRYIKLLKNNNISAYSKLIKDIIDYNCTKIHLITKEDNPNINFDKLNKSINDIVEYKIYFANKIESETGKTIEDALTEYLDKNDLLEMIIKIFIKTYSIERKNLESRQKSKI